MTHSSAVQTEDELGSRLVMVCELRTTAAAVGLFYFEPSVNIRVCCGQRLHISLYLLI